MPEKGTISYPHIKGAGVVIPDCSKGVYTPFRLTSREKRDLVKKLAEKGMRGIDDFLEEKRTEGTINDRLDELRKRMEKELERVKALRRTSLNDQVRGLRESEGIGLRESNDGSLRDDSAFRRYSSEEIRGEILASELIGALEGRVRIIDRQEKEGFLRSLWRRIRTFFIWIASKCLSFLGWIRRWFRRGERKEGSQERKKTHSKGAISLPFPSLSRDLDEWERRMEKDLDGNEHLQRAVNKRLSDEYGYTSGEIQLRRSFDPKWYSEEARKVLRLEVERSARLKKDELDDRRSEHLKTRKKSKDKERMIREKIMKMERNFESEMKDRERSIMELSKKEVKEELVSVLSRMGYLSRTEVQDNLDRIESEWEITEALVEKFSELIYAEIMEGRQGARDRRGSHISDAGVYEKAKLRMLGEEARMDLLQTIVNARTNHPRDKVIDSNDMVVLREVTTTEVHGVIIVDTSGSMEENSRLEAAKRSVLALTQAIKRENPRNRVDLISMSTRAIPISLKEVMVLEPRGFTNHHEALVLATNILDNTRADRLLLFLITDGLPEAYTDEKGTVVAGDLERSMELALIQASRLLRYRDLTFNIFLLEPEDETFVNAARRIAKEGEGRVIVADPNELASRVLGTYDDGTDVLGGV